jgi:hypothetical protein
VRIISAAEAAKLAAERAEQARLDLVRRQDKAAARRARARRLNAALATLGSLVMLGGILATAFLVVDLTPTPAPTGLFGAHAKVPVAAISAETEVFLATRKAVLRFGERPRHHCRQVGFNNESGLFSNEMVVRCNDEPTPPSQTRAAEIAGRFDSIRGSFVKQ